MQMSPSLATKMVHESTSRSMGNLTHDLNAKRPSSIQKLYAAFSLENLFRRSAKILPDASPSLEINRSKLQLISFNTLTHYLPNCKQLLKLHKRNQEIQELCKQLKQPTALKKILTVYRAEKAGNLAKDALKALQKNQLSIEQFCTLACGSALLYEFSELEIKVHPLFTQQGKIDQTARRILQSGFYQEGEQNFLTKEEAGLITEHFFDFMQSKPLSERFFFYIPIPSRKYRKTVRDGLTSQVGFRIFGDFMLKNKGYRMIPSFSMLQACVDAYGGENTLAPCPRIGLSTCADMRRNAAERGREVFIPFPGLSTPLKADGWYVRDFLDFFFHDIYHCMVCSQIPDHLRKELGLLADVVLKLQKELVTSDDVFAAPFLEVFYEKLIDMEFTLFRTAALDNINSALHELSKEELLLITLELQLCRNTHVSMRLKLRALLPKAERGPPASMLEEATLNQWDRLNEKVRVDRLQNGPIPFETLFQTYCENSQIAQHLALAFYHSGFLQRLNLSEENLLRANQNFPFKLQTLSFLDHLISYLKTVK